jgi:putative protease
MRTPELLAPAGDARCLEVAARAGADAIYFGLPSFNARARATNFSIDELGGTVRRLHELGVKGYVALNTLVFDAELPQLEAAIRACAEAGVDAVIVQDLGVARLICAIAPDLPIHASTQMTCTDAASVELAAELGARRVVLARELSLDDIAHIRARTSVELEVFVHGALCIAYSGQCLTSEAIGGRSANRGACAQACRLPYQLVVDGHARDLGDSRYLLSPEDLDAVAHVPRLVELGVSALKIEGRLKGPEYVAATVRLYRRAIDAALAGVPADTDAEHRVALQTFSRGSGPGFLDGVDHQRLVDGRTCDHRGLRLGTCDGVRTNRGRKVLAVRLEGPVARGDGILVEATAGVDEVGGRVWTIACGGADVEHAAAGQDVLLWLGPDKAVAAAAPGVRARVWKTNDPAAERSLMAVVDREPRRIPLAMRVTGAIGEHPLVEASLPSGATARVTVDAPLERARERPLDAAAVRDKLGKLGETPFVLANLAIDWDPGGTLPLAALNRARRAVVEALRDASHRTWAAATTAAASLLARPLAPSRPPAPPGLFVLCRTLPQARACLEAGADGVYLDFLELTGTGVAVRELRTSSGSFVGLAPPRIRKPEEDKIDRYLRSLEPDAILVRSLGALREGAVDDTLRIGDASLNVTNGLTAAEVLGRGLSAFTPSFDLDSAQLTAMLASPLGRFAEVVVHHPMPLFHMEHCVIAALLSKGKDHRTCGRPCESHSVSLRDRAGMDHPLEADVGCRNTVFHAAAQSGASLVPRLVAEGVRRFRLELVRETPADARALVSSYRQLIAGERGPESVWDDLRAMRTERGYGVVRGSLRVLDRPLGASE